MSNESTRVGEDFPKQQARVREVLGMYRDIGPNGMFGAVMIEQTLREADEAQASGDIIRILQSYQALKEIEA
jgi:hypothetical protein